MPRKTSPIPDPKPRITFGLDLTCPYCKGTGIRRQGMTKSERLARGKILAIYRRLNQEPPILDRTCSHCNGTGIEKWKLKSND